MFAHGLVFGASRQVVQDVGFAESEGQLKVLVAYLVNLADFYCFPDDIGLHR